MLRSEFEINTAIYPSSDLYEIIKKHYDASDVQKDTFCDAYRKNASGLAEQIQREADDKAYRQRVDYEDIISRKNAEIDLLEKQLARVQEDLDRELEHKSSCRKSQGSQGVCGEFAIEVEPLRDGKENQKKRYFAYIREMKIPADEVVEGINNDLHKDGITEERTILYLCDGKNPHCPKQDCYKNGGSCKHTKDITHAMNFRCEKNGDKDDYIEDQPMILQGILDELRRINQYIHEYQNGNAERVIEMKIHINGEYNKSTREDMKKIMLDAVKREC